MLGEGVGAALQPHVTAQFDEQVVAYVRYPGPHVFGGAVTHSSGLFVLQQSSWMRTQVNAGVGVGEGVVGEGVGAGTHIAVA